MKLRDAITETDKLRELQYPSGKVLRYAMRYIRPNKQLFIQAVVASGSVLGKTYQVRLVFNGLLSSDKRSRQCTLKYKDVDGSTYYIQKPTADHHIMTRCQCADYRFMWHWWLGDRKALLGPRIPYTRLTTHYPEKNPSEIPGICKHLLVLIKKLISVRFLRSDPTVLSYLNRPKKQEGKHQHLPKTKKRKNKK